MIIVNNEQVFNYHPIIKYIPKRLRKYLAFTDLSQAEEIRLRNSNPLMIYDTGGYHFIDEKGNLTKKAERAVRVYEEDIREAISLVSSSSLYAAEESLKEGFITVSGGNRVGICGHAEMKEGKIMSLSRLFGLNFRLAHEISAPGKKLCDKIENNGAFLNTLILSPPGCGKTTLLRGIIKELSYRGHKISVIDERNEISALHNGKAAFDLGYSCDIIEGIGKKEGFSIMLRAMSPEIIATDELGSREDEKTVEEAKNSGVFVIATAHARSAEDMIIKNKKLYDSFECIITLSRRFGPGTIEEITVND